MSPITQAAHRFAEDAESCWHDSPLTLVPLVAHEDQQEDVVEALRLYDTLLDHRRLFVVYRAPFKAAATYFSGLAVQIAGDYERVRASVVAEGVELPAFVVGDDGTVPSGALKRAAHTMHQAARLLGERFAGIVVALVPELVHDASGWLESVRILASTRWSLRVRIAAFAPLGGLLVEALRQGGAAFDVEPEGEHAPTASPRWSAGYDGRAPVDEISAEHATSTSPSAGAGTRLGAFLVDAAEALGAGRPVNAIASYRRARVLCQAEGLAERELTVLMALGAAYLAADLPELGAESYRQAALLAEIRKAWPLASRAWLGVGTAHERREKHAAAAVAFRAAAVAAKLGESVPLRIESTRLAGLCLLQLGREDEAMLELRGVVDLGVGVSASERRASTLAEAAKMLVKLLERRGLNEEAHRVRRIVLSEEAEEE